MKTASKPFESRNTVGKMRYALASCLALLFAVSANCAANASSYIVTLVQVGSEVVATGSGQLNLTGLNYCCSNAYQNAGELYPGGNNEVVAVGDWAGNSSSRYVTHSGFSGPSNFGPGTSVTFANGVSGLAVSIWRSSGTYGELWVPVGYTSDSFLSNSTAIFYNATFASLGVTPGTYAWSWGSGADQSFTLDIVGTTTTPLPAALPLFASGLGGLGLLGWWRRRRMTRAAA